MNNKEFLFLYDAALCNPNGDPDQDNKPRMDRATKTNLISDSRLKRYVRDYLIGKFDADPQLGQDVFVRMMGENKVRPETRLWSLAHTLISDREKLTTFVRKHPNLEGAFAALKVVKENPKNSKKLGEGEEKTTGKTKSTVKVEPFAGDNYDLYHAYFKPDKEFKDAFSAKELAEVNNEILSGLIKDQLIDARLFGGAFAIGGFSRTFIGPVQVNIGYSLHPVELNDSPTTVTLMSGSTEGASNIGKKETLRYSLIAFTGTVNGKRAAITGLGEDEDLAIFRESMILSILDWKTDSKKNQYPRLYLEIEYADEQIYGRLGDLRSLIKVESKVANDRGIVEPKDFTQVRSLNGLSVDFTALLEGIKLLDEQKRIKKVRVWTSLDKVFSTLTQKTTATEEGNAGLNPAEKESSHDQSKPVHLYDYLSDEKIEILPY